MTFFPYVIILSQLFDSMLGTYSYWDLITISLISHRWECIYLIKALVMQGLILVSRNRGAMCPEMNDGRVTSQMEGKKRKVTVTWWHGQGRNNPSHS